jgi:D-alanine-D-alanine ligase
MQKKENVAVFFGGKSVEHDISIITGLQVIANIDREKYNIIPIYLSREGEMFFGDKLSEISAFANFNKKDKKIKRAVLNAGSDIIFISKNSDKITKCKFSSLRKIDCAVICCHGLNGEDGTLQGLLELCDIPYTSSGVLSSAVCMDKIIMKDIFIANNIDTATHISFNRNEFTLDSERILNGIEDKLEYPLFVKPSNLGSSIGISKCKDREGLENAIEIASSYDSRILVEQSIEDNIEVNCAVFGNMDHQITSNLEYPKSWSSFLSFDEKYIMRNKSSKSKDNFIDKKQDEDYKGFENTSVDRKNTKVAPIINKKLSEEIEEEIKILAKKVFKIFNCIGVVRIDFLVESTTNKIYVNELNSIPGSLAYYLFEEYSFKTLLNRLIDIAKKQAEDKKKNKFSYQSSALANFSSSSKLNK